MPRTFLFVLVCSVFAASVSDADAQVGQPWTDRGYFNFNVGFEGTSGTLTDATTFTLYDESGTKNVQHAVDSGSLIDLSFGGRVWRNVSIGLGFHRGSTSGEAAVTGAVPNPLFFNRPRNVALSASGLDRTEQALHLQFGYMLLINDRLDVHLFIGPSFFNLKQEVVSDVSITEQAFPFTNVNADAAVTEREDSATGANVGADVSYKVYETANMILRAGMFLRYTGASGKVTVLASERDSDVGGLQVGFGARVRF